MKILIDIGHPAHVHYFKNFIRLMTKKNHEFLIIARNKEITLDLLKKYNIPFISRGDGGKTIFSKIMYLPKAVLKIYKHAKIFNPDIFLSFSSTYAAWASKINRKKHIALDDTEHSKLELLLYPPFTDTILTPSCFTKKIGDKQIFFNSYTELLYLHSKYFTPNLDVLRLLNISKYDKYAFVRFVSWDATHDTNHKGLSNKDKIDLVKFLSKRMKVFVSSEQELPSEIEKYIFSISPEYIHDALFFSDIYVGEGGTTASEACILGTPSVYMNNLSMGYIEEEKKIGLLYQSTDKIEIKKYIDNIINTGSLNYKRKAKHFIENKIDPTSLLIWFVENYPKSHFIMKNNLDFQNKFR